MSANPNGSRMSRGERHEWVCLLREQGHTFKEIAQIMGVHKSTVTGVYYDPTGEQDRARKLKHSGVCVDCGATTAYRTGGPAKRCLSCRNALHRTLEHRRTVNHRTGLTWSDEQIIDALRAVGEPGVPLSSLTYERFREASAEPMPSMPLVATRFGGWAKAVRAAGLTPPARKLRDDRMPVEGAWLAVEQCEADLGHVPTYSEYEAWAHRTGGPCGTTVRQRIGGWRAVLNSERAAA